MIKFHCDQCGKKIGVPDEHLGRRVKCPGCKRPVVVVNEAAAAAGGALSEMAPPPAPAVENEPTVEELAEEMAIPEAEAVFPLAPIDYASPVQSSGTRRMLILACLVGLGMIVGLGLIVALLVSSRKPTPVQVAAAPPSKAVQAPVAPPPPPPPAQVKLTYEQFAKEIGSEFKLEKEPMMDGTTKYIGTNDLYSAVVVLQGQPEDIRYAHLAIAMTPLARKFFSLTMTQDEIETASNGDRRTMDLIEGQSLLIRAFFRSVAGNDFRARGKWFCDNLEVAMDGKSPSPQTIVGGVRFMLEGDPRANMIKICVAPN